MQDRAALTFWHPERTAAPLTGRVLARLIDFTLLGIIACLVDWGTGGAFFQGLEWFGQGIIGLPQVSLSLLLGGFLYPGYFIFFHRYTGQTFGKWLCRLVILKQGQHLPGWTANLLREVTLWLTFATGGWLLCVMFFSAKNRGLHDFISGVTVYTRTDS